MSGAPLLSRVAQIEKRITSGAEEDKEMLPKLADLRSRIRAFEETYEERLAAVQERNRQAMENLAKLQDRVQRRATAKAESDAKAVEAAELKAAEAKETKAKAKAKTEPKPSREAKAKSRRTAPPVMPMAPMLQYAEIPHFTEADMQVMMQAVGLPVAAAPVKAPCMKTPEYWSAPHCAESPFVPFATPECWDNGVVGTLLLPLVAA
jgi:hypothetical protein